MTSLDDWLTSKEAAALAGYHLEYIRRLVRAGELEARKWGSGAWMINKDSLLRYLERMETQGERRGPKPKN